MPEIPPPAGVGAIFPQGLPSALGSAAPGPPKAALEYTRRVFENVTGWYQNADTKAQVILTLDGAFLAFLTGAMFAEPAELRPILAEFSAATRVLLLLMSVCLVGSIASALTCLWSRLYTRGEVREIFRGLGVRTGEAGSYAPEVTWFFQLVRRLDGSQYRTRLLGADEEFEIRALASQIRALSENVARKHLWVNVGFLLAGTSLVLFLAAGVSYVVRL